MLRVVDASSGEEIEHDNDGVFIVWDQREYLVQAIGEPLRAQPPVLHVQRLGNIATLCFDNYVGLAEVLGYPFRVRHGKLTEEAFQEMLDGVVAETADLAFSFDSPASLPFERDVTMDEDVAYHGLGYLRQVMRRADEGEHLLGQFLEIAANPHRRILNEPEWIGAASASGSISTQGMIALASHPERLLPVSPSSRLLDTGLGRLLSRRRPVFPGTVLGDRCAETVDTHENRLVKRILRGALDLVQSFERKTFVNPALREDLAVMRGELEWMSSFGFLQEVEELTMVPFQSTVMQRREGYRQFLRHYVQLSMGSTLAADRHTWQRLLDLKDGALLYEMWAFFEVKRVLDDIIGEPTHGELTTLDDERRRVPWSARVTYGDDLELVYNRKYPGKSTSYSITFRPDIVVRAHHRAGWSCLVFDAKLKFDGVRLGEIEEDDPEDWQRSATRADLYKMHTYRDAISEAAGAYVLYPGNKSVRYPDTLATRGFEGVGAIALLPGESSEYLTSLVEEFVEAMTSS